MGEKHIIISIFHIIVYYVFIFSVNTLLIIPFAHFFFGIVHFFYYFLNCFILRKSNL